MKATTLIRPVSNRPAGRNGTGSDAATATVLRRPAIDRPLMRSLPDPRVTVDGRDDDACTDGCERHPEWYIG